MPTYHSQPDGTDPIHAGDSGEAPHPAESGDADRLRRSREHKGLVYGFLFGLVAFGGIFLYLRAGILSLLFVLVCFAGMLFFSKL